MKKSIWFVLGLLGLPAVVMAHPGHDMVNLATGFSHSFFGIDHLLVILAVGFWAGQSKSSARWQVPLQFVLFLTAGVALALMIPGPVFLEAAIAISVMTMGLILLLSASMHRMWQLTLMTVVALLHGFVHGQELFAASSGHFALAGMLLATMVLLTMGVYLASFKDKVGFFMQRGFAALLAFSGTYLLMI